MLLESGFGGRDIQLDVLDTPHRVPANAVEDAISLLRGHSTLALPVLYVSARSGGQYLVDVDKMSYDLGGLAHVVLEPNRRFSFSLREALDGENPYDGVLALIMPGLGVVKKYFPPAYRDSELNIASVIRRDISRITSDRPAKFGIDWAGLQAMFSRHARAALQNRDDESSVEEYMEAFDKEILAKNEEIERLKGVLDERQAVEAFRMSAENGILNPELVEHIPQLFRGEISDRVRYVIARAVESESLGLTRRDISVLERILSASDYSGNALALAHEIRVAGRDATSACRDLSRILLKHNFSRADEGKHVRLTPPSSLLGLDAITLAKTPSDHRSGKNEASQINNTLGLTNLK